MKKRYVSAQLLLNKDGSLKAQRIYEIPEPATVSFYLCGYEPATDEDVLVGVMCQEWHGTHDILDNHPACELLIAVLEKRFGMLTWDSSLGF